MAGNSLQIFQFQILASVLCRGTHPILCATSMISCSLKQNFTLFLCTLYAVSIHFQNSTTSPHITVHKTLPLTVFFLNDVLKELCFFQLTEKPSFTTTCVQKDKKLMYSTASLQCMTEDPKLKCLLCFP